MPSTAIQTYSGQQLQPLLRPDKAIWEHVALQASTTYVAGQVLGELTATPGTFAPYQSTLIGQPTAAPALTPSGSGGSLTPGQWQGYVTYYTSGTGETTPGPTSVVNIVGSQGIAAAAVTTPSGASQWRLYLAAPNTNTFKLAATANTGVAPAVINANPTGAAAPTANTLTQSQVIAAPGVPVITTQVQTPSTGGSIAAGTYHVGFTYYGPGTQETTLSPLLTTTAITGTGSVIIKANGAIVPPSGATGIRVYIDNPAGSDDVFLLGAITAAQLAAASPDITYTALPAQNQPTPPQANTLVSHSDGSQVAKALLSLACTTDASGNITAEGQWGVARPSVAVCVGGGSVFRCQDLVGLDATAVAQMGGAIVEGNTAIGQFRF